MKRHLVAGLAALAFTANGAIAQGTSCPDDAEQRIYNLTQALQNAANEAQLANIYRTMKAAEAVCQDRPEVLGALAILSSSWASAQSDPADAYTLFSNALEQARRQEYAFKMLGDEEEPTRFMVTSDGVRKAVDTYEDVNAALRTEIMPALVQLQADGYLHGIFDASSAMAVCPYRDQSGVEARAAAEASGLYQAMLSNPDKFPLRAVERRLEQLAFNCRLSRMQITWTLAATYEQAALNASDEGKDEVAQDYARKSVRYAEKIMDAARQDLPVPPHILNGVPRHIASLTETYSLGQQ